MGLTRPGLLRMRQGKPVEAQKGVCYLVRLLSIGSREKKEIRPSERKECIRLPETRTFHHRKGPFLGERSRAGRGKEAATNFRAIGNKERCEGNEKATMGKTEE